MLDLTPFFIFLIFCVISAAGVACFGIVFGMKFKYKDENMEINTDKLKGSLHKNFLTKEDYEKDVSRIEDTLSDIKLTLEDIRK